MARQPYVCIAMGRASLGRGLGEMLRGEGVDDGGEEELVGEADDDGRSLR